MSGAEAVAASGNLRPLPTCLRLNCRTRPPRRRRAPCDGVSTGTRVRWRPIARDLPAAGVYCGTGLGNVGDRGNALSVSSMTSTTSSKPTRPATPEHVAIIMDGNGRWAGKRGAIASVGHKAGIDALQRTVEGCVELGVRFLSVFALSTENSINRAAEEVTFLVQLVRSVVSDRLDKLHKEGVRLRFVGNLEGIGDPHFMKIVREAEILTAANDTLTLTVALNFSGTDDIVRSTRAVAQRVRDGSIDVADIDAAMISDSLSMGYIAPENREPDLLIRTGGERRVSNFLLFELAYTELYFSDVLWPDWDLEELEKACADFGLRERRFGG
jgi:undecaprenyl diphosphate synthase